MTTSDCVGWGFLARAGRAIMLAREAINILLTKLSKICAGLNVSRRQSGKCLNAAFLASVAQQMVSQHAGQHGLTNGDGTNTNTRIMTTLCQHLDLFAFGTD